jgi:hypothetical protein
MLLLLLLPLPADKLLEIRPDTLSTVFLIVALIFYYLWLHLDRRVHVWGLMMGMMIVLSGLTLPKLGPNLLLVGAFVLFGFLRHRLPLKPVLIGFSIPLIVFIIYAVSIADIGKIYYSLIKLPLEANRISESFGMRPDHFFNPNDFVYGCSGWCDALFINHLLWLIGSGMLIHMALSAGTGSVEKKTSGELLISSNGIVQIILFVHVVASFTIIPEQIHPLLFNSVETGFVAWLHHEHHKCFRTIFVVSSLQMNVIMFAPLKHR